METLRSGDDAPSLNSTALHLCFDATKFGGLTDAIELAAAKKIPAVEYAFAPFSATAKSAKLSAQEKEYLAQAAELSGTTNVKVAAIRLSYLLDVTDKKASKTFSQMISKLGSLCTAVGCNKIIFHLQPGNETDWIVHAESLVPVVDELSEFGVKLLLSLSTPEMYRGKSLRFWRPFQPQEWRDLLACCPGLGLSFSAADCVWQSIDYLQILPGLVSAIEHVEANDIEINRPMLMDSGLFGPLWWRYRRPGKGQVDWGQLIEALKLYEYKGAISIHLDDEFIGDTQSELEDGLDASIPVLAPFLRY